MELSFERIYSSTRRHSDALAGLSRMAALLDTAGFYPVDTDNYGNGFYMRKGEKGGEGVKIQSNQIIKECTAFYEITIEATSNTTPKVRELVNYNPFL